MSPNIYDLRGSLRTLEMLVKQNVGTPRHEEAIRQRDAKRAELEQAERDALSEQEFSIEPSANADHPSTLDFLNLLAPHGPWAVRSISSMEGGPPKLPNALGYYVTPQNASDEAEGLQAWIRCARAGKQNCYTHAAIGQNTKPKLAREDIYGSRVVWAEVDPADKDNPVRDAADFEERRATILAAMRAEEPPFSVIVDSGNGYQGFKHIEPFAIKSEADRALLENANRAIAVSLNARLHGTGLRADKVHSVDHLMRLPGSTNFMTKSKREKGYPEGERLARIVEWHPEHVYRLLDLPTLPEVAPKAPERAELDDEKAIKIDADDLRILLDGLDPANYRDRAPWLELMMAAHSATGGEGRAAFVDWSKADPPFANDEDGIGKTWDSLNAECKDGVTIATLLKALHDAGRSDLVASVMGSNTSNVLDRRDWTTSARFFVERRMPMLRHHNGEFLNYASGAYREVEEDYLTAVARDFLSNAKVRSDEKVVPFKPSRADIQELLAAVKDGRHLSRDSFSPPCWLDDDHAHVPAPQCVSFPNGILHLPSGNFTAATPTFFTRNALEFAYDPQAQCPLWLDTLDQYWPRRANGDPADEVLLLQEVFGYLVSSDTSQQKMVFVLGPPRSGKGVISRLLAQLVGHANCTSPSLSSLGGEFGRMPLIGKQLAIISETKLDARKDNAVAIAGYLLAISGEDSLSINRKNKPFWEGRLPVRFLWLGNKIPTFADDGTALGNRLVILAMTESFLGHEDLTLEARLKDELAGILNWAVEGWRRLQARGHFVQTESGNAAQAEFIRLASPTLAFVQEKCVIDNDVQVTKDDLYRSYKDWALANGRLADNKNEFGASLVAACGGRVRSHRPEVKSLTGKVDRPWCWRGIHVAEVGPF